MGQLDEEIAWHIDLRTEDLMRSGLGEAEARAEAERMFGGSAAAARLRSRVVTHHRRHRLQEWLAELGRDITYSARSIAREPVVAGGIIATFGLGFGANALMFGVLDRVLLRGPDHVVEPERVQRVYLTQPGGEGGAETRGVLPYAVAPTLAGAGVFAGVAAYLYQRMPAGSGAMQREELVGLATPELFPLLGVRPALGRFFTAEDLVHDSRVAVLAHDYWQGTWGGLPGAIGRSAVINGEEYTIIGVAPQAFTGAELRPARIWIPISAQQPTDDWQTTWQAWWATVVVRLPRQGDAAALAGVGTSHVQAALAEAGAGHAGDVRMSLHPPGYTMAGRLPPEVGVARWLAGVSGVVLLVACANVVNLLLARSLRRRREIAVRLALGISRGRLARLFLSETLLLALLGGFVGLLVVALGAGVFRGLLLPDVAWDDALGPRVLLFSAALIILTTAVVAVAPILQVLRHEVAAGFTPSWSRGATPRGRTRRALVAVQAGLALVLLVGAAHFVRSLNAAGAVDLGIEPHEILIVRPAFPALDDVPPADREALRERRAVFLPSTVERLRALPDIASAAIGGNAPMTGGTAGTRLRVPGRDSIPSLPGGGPYVIVAGPGYFETVGTPIIRGRGIRDGDGPGTEPIVVVNESMARTLWPGEEPLGKCLVIGRGDAPPCASVVGVARDARRSALREEPAMQYYVPWGQAGMRSGGIIVRPLGSAARYQPTLQRVLHELEPAADHFAIMPLAATLEPQLRPWRLGAALFALFGVLALLVGAVGLYSVVAYSVAERTPELGVRLALGASGTALTAMVVRQALESVVPGILGGLVLAFIGGWFLEPILFETSTRDPFTLLAMTALLVLVAAVAGLIPALAAGRMDPAAALRAE